MSAKEYNKQIILKTTDMYPQLSGSDASIEPLQITVNVPDVLEPAKGTEFFLEVDICSRVKVYIDGCA